LISVFISKWKKVLRFRRAFFLCWLFPLCVACETYLFDPADDINSLASKYGWQKYSATYRNLTLAGFFKGTSKQADVLHIYIEGDGAPWPSPWAPPEDPTPLTPVALKMALADPHPHILYVARPCQLTRGKARQGCHIKLWTSARFSSAVVDLTNTAITRYVDRIGATQLVLFGYSGGGAVAALVAARRMDVISLVTAAGTLDHAAWTAHHKATPLKGSLNPARFGKKLSKISQIHFVGENDDIMPLSIAKSYLKNLGAFNKAQIILLTDYDHSCCWASDWPKLLLQANLLD
jgi:dienelactone hydrolase